MPATRPIRILLFCVLLSCIPTAGAEAQVLEFLSPGGPLFAPADTAAVPVSGRVSLPDLLPNETATVSVSGTSRGRTFGVATVTLSGPTPIDFSFVDPAPVRVGFNRLELTAGTARASGYVVIDCESPVSRVQRAFDGINRLIDELPPGITGAAGPPGLIRTPGPREGLVKARDAVLASFKVYDENGCLLGFARQLRKAVRHLQGVDHEAVPGLIDELSLAATCAVGQRMEILQRRVGDRHPSFDDALSLFDAAHRSSDARERIGRLMQAEATACDVFDQAPHLLTLAVGIPRVETRNFWSLARTADISLNADFGSAGEIAAGARGEAAVLDRDLDTMDHAHYTASGSTTIASHVLGEARLLTGTSAAREVAVFDEAEGSVRRFRTDTGVELSPVPVPGAPQGLAYSPDGTRLAVTLAGSPSVQFADLRDGSWTLVEANLPGPGACAYLENTDRIAVLCADATVRIVDGTGVTATSLPLEDPAAIAYLSALDRVAVLCLPVNGFAFIRIFELIDLDFLRDIDLTGLVPDPPALSSVSGRDLVIIDARSSTVVVDADQGEIIETLELDSGSIMAVSVGN